MSAPRPRASAVVLVLVSLLVGCGPDGCGGPAPSPDGGVVDAGAPDAGPSPHCEVDLSRFLAGGGSGARALKIGAASQLIGGPNAQGRVGDFLLENGVARFIVQGEDRTIGPQPYGGTVLDADVQRDGGAGNDQMGELGLLYNFGRTVDPTVFEILRDGSSGGPVVLAATGEDSPNDYLSIRNQLRNQLGSVPRADPYVALPLTITNYFVLAPGEQRLRFVSAFCNHSSGDVLLGVGDLADPGYGMEFFNGQACTDGFGYGGSCQGIDRMSWYGYLGTGVAWGYAPWKSNTPTQPEPTNTVLTVAGVTGSFLSSPGVTGLAEWFSDVVVRPQGSLVVPAGGKRYVVRDVLVGRDLGELASIVATTRAAVTGSPVGEVHGVVRSGGVPVAGARVSFKEAEGHAAVFDTDAEGRYAGTLPVRSYDVAAWKQGRTPSASQPLSLSGGASAQVDLELPAGRTLSVSVKDASDGSPLPARVTVVCRGGACPTSRTTLNRFTNAVGDPLLDSMQALAWVPPSGTVDVALPPGEYEVFVSRGPEYSIFPQDFRTAGGTLVDLRTADGTLEARLQRVVDTAGWTSADFHVHAINGPDSAVTNRDRVLTFLGDGVDVLVSTDHDHVTDYAPEVASLGATGLMATVVGEEVSTMDFGHYNLFPLTVKADSLNGGALDWAGGRGPTLTPRQLFASGRAMGARTVHLNHPRGSLGAFTHLRVDTDTLATHADPRDFNMAPPAGGTAEDTLLFDGTFNAIELLNSGEDGFDLNVARGRFNDWFTLLSRGLRITATGVSDTHGKNVASGWRTWVKAGAETPAALDPVELSSALNAQQAVASNGPFVQVSAHRVRASSGEITSVDALPGGTVPAGTDDVEVTVDVQVPEYLDVSRIELYLHRPEDDEQCPRDPTSTRAATARVACNGVENLVWPASGVAASVDVTPSPAELEIAATVDGVSYKRWHVVRKIRIPAPATDNWIVAMVYGSKSLFPLLYRATSEGSSTFTITPFALTNPIYVDADGNGFDHPPFSPLPRARPRALPLGRAAERRGPITPGELTEAWGNLQHRH